VDRAAGAKVGAAIGSTSAPEACRHRPGGGRTLTGTVVAFLHWSDKVGNAVDSLSLNAMLTHGLGEGAFPNVPPRPFRSQGSERPTKGREWLAAIKNAKTGRG